MSQDVQTRALEVEVSSETLRRIRRHARGSMKEEVCGVLVGSETANGVRVQASIAGEGAGQGSAHVTFTHETWEHIYKIKDEKYPDEKIVGWYHSHPGFGIFLSEHDTFVHENFFSGLKQIAWVYDPHSDEEGCFGWANGKVERLDRIVSTYDGRDAPSDSKGRINAAVQRPTSDSGRSADVVPRRSRWASSVKYALSFALGCALTIGILLLLLLPYGGAVVLDSRGRPVLILAPRP
jgi:proteasome lid subunit RPN8/RPN11